MPEERRRIMQVKYGDKLVPLGDRLDLLEKRINIQSIILVILVIDHIGTFTAIWNIVSKMMFGL